MGAGHGVWCTSGQAVLTEIVDWEGGVVVDVGLSCASSIDVDSCWEKLERVREVK